ncbi:GDP-fucose protein O-fucosyltransferase 3-like isoform X1 [Crassostrea virginica]
MRRGHKRRKDCNEEKSGQSELSEKHEANNSKIFMFLRKLRLYRQQCSRTYFLYLVTLAIVLLYAITSTFHREQKPLDQKDKYFVHIDHPIILWWTTYGGKSDENITCGEVQCRVSVDRSLKSHNDTQAIIFYGTSLELADLPLPRNPRHIWALKHEESPKNNDFMFSHEEIVSLFNYTSTFKRQSDYPLPTQYLPNLDYLLVSTMPFVHVDSIFVVDVKTKSRLRKSENLAPVLYVQSDCGASSDRDEFVKLLQEFIPVDSYGECLHNKDLPDHLRFDIAKSMSGMHHDDFHKLAAKYKFTLAMENAVCDDYITEKLWRPLRLGSLPIVFGSPKVKDFLPSNKSAILVSDFSSVKELAEFLKELDANDEKYKDFFDWKSAHRISNQFLVSHMEARDWGHFSAVQKNSKKFHSHMAGFDCFICRKIHDIQKAHARNKSPVSHSATIDHYGCPAPKRFNASGHFGVYDKWWAEPWFYSKYLAKAFRKYYDNNQHSFNHEDLTALARKLRKEDENG